MSLAENKRSLERGHKRFIKSVKRQGKQRSSENLHLTLGHSKNIKHLVKTKNVFSKSDFSDNTDNRFKIPEIFSLVDEPVKSFAFLKKLLFSLYNQDSINISIDFKDCQRIDLDASICMDIILKDVISYYNKRKMYGYRNHVRTIKIVNESEKIKKFLFSTGAYKNIANNQYKDDKLICYPLCIGYRTHKKFDKKREAKKEQDVTKLVDYVIECLRKMNKPELSAKTKKYIADISGEIMTNAEDHSSTNYRYSIGYFEDSFDEDKNHYGIFNLVILNFGETIYERINNPEACKNVEIIKQMQELSSKYTNKNWFLGDSFKEETLWTLYALQDGVSSISPHRGNGTIKFMDCFFRLKGNDGIDDVSKMTILSGNASITFDGKYQIKTIYKGPDEHKVMTFNDDGDISNKPDEKYVKFVPNYFPGTIIIAKILIREDDTKI